jgi:hypothetical protein
MLLTEENRDIQALISDIDKNASIIRKQKMLSDYPEIEQELLEIYQKLVIPFIEEYINVEYEISSDNEEILRNDLLDLLQYLLDVIEANK